MPSPRAVTWSRGEAGRGARGPLVGQGRGGDAHRARLRPGDGAALPFVSAHLSRPRTHRGGLFQVSRHGQGQSGAGPPPALHLYPRGTKTIPGLGPPLPAPQSPARAAAPAKGTAGISRLRAGAPHGFDAALGWLQRLRSALLAQV